MEKGGLGDVDHEVVYSIIIVLYLVSFFSMILFTAKVTGSDPTDPTVALERLHRYTVEKKSSMKPNFNPQDYMFHCDVCDTHVLKNTKHCGRCNRCTYEFDHHCVWVSNDIGLHNYIDFIRMLTAVFFTIVFQLIFCAYTLANISDKTYIDHDEDDDEKMVGLMKVDSLVALNWATIVLSNCLIILDSYLLCFHFYLIKKNLSTYKHIRRKLKRRKSSIIREVNQNQNN